VKADNVKVFEIPHSTLAVLPGRWRRASVEPLDVVQNEKIHGKTLGKIELAKDN
jgi:hypothetical protein